MPPESGRTKAVPRFPYAFVGRGRDAADRTVDAGKRALVSSIQNLVLTGALPESNQLRVKPTELKAQGELAAGAGIRSRATFTRRLANFYAGDATSAPSTAIGCSPDAVVGGAETSRRDRVPILSRDRGWAEPNRYAYAVPEGDMAERNPKCWLPPYARQLAEDRRFHGHFIDDGVKQIFKAIPLWTADPRLPYTEIERLFLRALMFCGLLDENEAGRPRGAITVHQEKIARMIGVSMKSVYLAQRAWEGKAERWGVYAAGQPEGEFLAWYPNRRRAEQKAHKLTARARQRRQDAAFEVRAIAMPRILRVAHSKPRLEQGRYVRGPCTFVYLPVRYMTKEEAEGERMRMAEAAARLLAAGNEWAAWLKVVFRLHEAMLASQAGTERTISVFWRMVRSEMAGQGVPRPLIDALVPRPPD